MQDRKARGTASARQANKEPSGKEPSGDSDASEEVAQEHEANLNQLRDEPVQASHYDERHRLTEQQPDEQE
jgi:hypothetical protein